MMVAEMELSKVDNKTKLETTLREEEAIRQDNKDREMERLADAAEKAARVTTPIMCFYCSENICLPFETDSYIYVILQIMKDFINPCCSLCLCLSATGGRVGA